MRDYQEIVSKINTVHFTGCEAVRCGDVLYYLIQYRKDENHLILFLKSIKHILARLLTYEYDVEARGEKNSLFLYATSTGDRPDLFQSFYNVARLPHNSIIIKPSSTKKFRPGRIKFLPLVFKWIRDCKSIDLPFSTKIFSIAFILDAYATYEYLKKQIDYETINNLVVFCDVHSVDSFFVQMFNELNKNTITLQHGNVCSAKGYSWPIIASQSKYFLAYNQFTINESKNVDYRNSMILVGFFSFVNSDNYLSYKTFPDSINTIGVFLEGAIFDVDNYRMIEVVAEYCLNTHKKLKIKLHPTCDKERYQNKYSQMKDIEFVDKNYTVIQFCDEIDVAVIRNSATLSQSLQYGIPSYIMYDDQQIAKIYKNVDILKFSNAYELETILDNRNMNCIRKDLLAGQELFCCSGDITQKYINALAEFGID